MLRLPAIRLNTWYRVAEIAHARGLVGATKLRLARFLNTQRLDPRTGRIEGRYGSEQTDGGLALAERYACVYNVGRDRFWDDLKGLYRAGLAERVQAPAPGRRAVYALCLVADAIPRDLPDDLVRELRTWDLPEVEDPDEDAVCQRLASRQAPADEPVVVRCAPAELRELAAAPRWAHPAGSPAALVAAELRAAAKLLPSSEIPALQHAAVVADPTRAAEMTARVSELMQLLQSDGKPSPSYAKGSTPGGCSTAGCSGLSYAKKHGEAQRTPLRAAEAVAGCFQVDPGAVATSVLRRVWAVWRRELGHGRTLLPTGDWDDAGGWHSGSGPTWDDLHRLVRIALERTTPGEIFETLSGSMASAAVVGRVAAGRLWRLINARRDRHQYAPHARRGPNQAPHVTAWDEAAPARRRWLAEETGATSAPDGSPTARTVGAELRQRMREDAERRRQEAEDRRTAQFTRWGINAAPLREPEEVHRAAAPAEDEPPRSAAQVRAAALARARAEKRARIVRRDRD